MEQDRINMLRQFLEGEEPVWDIDSSNGIKKAAERMAINMPIQGSAAEMIKVAMILSKKINKLGMKSK